MNTKHDVKDQRNIVFPLEPAATSAADERISRNITLFARFMEAVFADPSILDDIPEGADLVFLPDDDPDLARANVLGGREMERAGRRVHFQHLASGSAGRAQSGPQ